MESTIYSYRLVKKIPHHLIFELLFALLFLLLFLWNLTQNRALPYIICYPAVFVLHIVITQCYRTFIWSPTKGIWSFKFGIYWCGLLPDGYTPLQKIIKIQLHLLAIGLFMIAITVPWLGGVHALNLLYIHLWIMLPRLWVLWRSKPYKVEGLIKISARDSSCYLQ
ncbi:hypothetical protein NV379_25725 [Paenibacillus sp. N1-5-1-14]|uniref:hypothetical protein n=1 Tax=Paenibacillus radicibacter TaxID=2972488 RepID=UPI002158DC92|nr:hypothetical protein [Paenibacillus radicibacter]MCR8645893.1 hypothetical protein [Paenibacillus radicibacter]MCR8646024.1 hypothetical protein [Paenibacillus radicibacter]